MSESTSIEWTGSTWNPVRGCTKIAAGCKNCYAERFAERFRGVPGHPYELGFDPRTAPDQLAAPLRWRTPRRIFVNSMSDLFHEAFSFEYIAAVFGIMAACADRELGHTFQVLTKRPARAAEFFRWLGGDLSTIQRDWNWWRQCGLHESVKAWMGYNHPERPSVNLRRGWPLPNVWVGTSVSTQADVDRNLPELLRVPAAVRFLSAEPLLEPVGLGLLGTIPRDVSPQYLLVMERIDWVIVGGESGPGARPCSLAAVESVVAQCRETDVPVFVKQLGARPMMSVCGAEYRLKLKSRKGGDPEEWPPDLRIREFPRELEVGA
ncbi:MAG: phage Gp37/Gp68 family protein [Thermoanaerobaculia bacterium]